MKIWGFLKVNLKNQQDLSIEVDCSKWRGNGNDTANPGDDLDDVIGFLDCVFLEYEEIF